MEVEHEVTVKGTVTCPHCGEEHEAEITDTVVVEVEPEEPTGDPD